MAIEIKPVSITAGQAGYHEIRALHDHIGSRGPCEMNDFLRAIVVALEVGQPVSVTFGDLPLTPLPVVATIIGQYGVPVADEEEIWGALLEDDLIVACPWKDCDNTQDFVELDQSHVRHNEVTVDGPWVHVDQDSGSADMHTLGWECGSCHKPVSFPAAAELSPVWS